MQIEAIKALQVPAEIQPSNLHIPSVSFTDVLGDGVQQINTDLRLADDLISRYARGENVDTDELMIALEQAQLSLKLAVEVKNKLTSAYQELFRMQV